MHLLCLVFEWLPCAKSHGLFFIWVSPGTDSKTKIQGHMFHLQRVGKIRKEVDETGEGRYQASYQWKERGTYSFRKMLKSFIEHVSLVIMPEGEGIEVFTYHLPSVIIVETFLCHEFLRLSELQTSTTSKKASGKEM